MGWQLHSVPELTDEQFERWCVLLESRIGMQVAIHQRSFLQIQIARRVRELDFANFDEYFEYIQEGIQGLMEWRQLIDRLVVRETSFFREPDSLDFVSSQLQRRIASRSLEGGFDVWSLGCATGEEPYSLAMELNNCFERQGLAPQFSITASDVSQQALQQAKEAVYSTRKLERVSSENLGRYFDEIEPGFWEVDPALQRRICFAAMNLLDLAKVPLAPMDIIYCQNVLIYFRRWRRREILDELVTRLKPGGLLIIGMGELVDWSSSLVTRVADNRVQAYLRRE